MSHQSSPTHLRDYQIDAHDAIEHAFAHGIRRPLLSLPTGGGKTVVFVELIRRRGGRALVLVHRDELVQQAKQRLREHAPELHVGVVKAEQDEVGAQVVIASVQTLAHAARLARIVPNFTTVVVDECHHAVAPSYIRVLQHVRAFEADGPLVLGVSATPYRADGTGLDEVFEKTVYDRDLLSMIREGWLVDLVGVPVTVQANFDRIGSKKNNASGSGLDDIQAENILMAANVSDIVVHSYREHALGRRALVFTPGVRSAREMAGVFNRAGIAAEAIVEDTTIPERRKILERLREGTTRVVSNCLVLTEGLDAPAVDCIVIARPTKGRGLYTQMVGRGTRPSPATGKKDCIVLDLAGATRRHELMSLGTLVGMKLQKRESLMKAEQRIAREREHAERKNIDLARVQAERVDLFAKKPSRHHWAIAPQGDLAVMSLMDQGSVQIWLRGQTWDAVYVDPSYARTTLATGLSLDAARDHAEVFIEKRGIPRFVTDPSAGWRSRPTPSDGQISAARRIGMTFPARVSCGQAGDLLTIAFARRSVNSRRWGQR